MPPISSTILREADKTANGFYSAEELNSLAHLSGNVKPDGHGVGDGRLDLDELGKLFNDLKVSFSVDESMIAGGSQNEDLSSEQLTAVNALHTTLVYAEVVNSSMESLTDKGAAIYDAWVSNPDAIESREDWPEWQQHIKQAGLNIDRLFSVTAAYEGSFSQIEQRLGLKR